MTSTLDLSDAPNHDHFQVTQLLYRQGTVQSITAIRADLVSMIHAHTLKLSTSSSSRDAASTLMSADVEQFATGSRNMHECWGSLLDVALGIWLLQTRLGLAVAVTGGIMATFLLLTFAVLPAGAKRQNDWLKALETRIAATTQSLRAMKGVKMTGVASNIRRILMGLRKTEGRKLRRFRYILLIVAWAAWIPVILAPILGFTLYSVGFHPGTGHILTPATVYRCLTIFNLLGNAVAVAIESAIKVVMSVAALLRIQAFLLDDNTRLENRELLPSLDLRRKDDEEKPLLSPLLSPYSPSRRPSSNLIRMKRLSRSLVHAPVALRLTGASAGWNSDTPSIVHNANLDLSAPTVVAVVGPIGCGKTTLLQMLLGETRCAAGSVALSSLRVGYCSQSPWLTSATIKHNIVGSGVFEEKWYNTVIRATALDEDFREMPLRDSTVVGNEGTALSGGQKKRVALARAIYTKAPIIVLDDPFNGLDGRTETAVLEAVLGRQGLLRQQKTLVVWATSTSELIYNEFCLKYTDNTISSASQGRRSCYNPDR